MYKIGDQIKSSLFFRILAILSSFILVPITLGYLGKEQYGIWVTLLSIMSWITFFDVGFGNGMRNKIAESLAINDSLSAKKYISTAYLILALFALFLFIVVHAISRHINLTSFFNSSLGNDTLYLLLNYVVLFILINFVLSLVNQVFNATHQTSMIAFNQLLANLIALILTYIAVKFTKNNILLIAIIYCCSMCLSNIVFNIYCFKRNRGIAPSFSFYETTRIPDIFSFGFKIFLIQISAMLVFTTDNIIIAQFIGPKDVTDYTIVNKLFAVVIFFHNILMAPFWSAFTDAYARQNLTWIRAMLRKLNLFMLPLIFVTVIISIFSRQIIGLWVGNSVIFNYSLIFFMAVFVTITCWNNIYAYFLNGISETKLQLITSLIAIAIKSAVLYFFFVFNKLTVESVILSSIFALLPFAFLGYRQTYSIVQERYAYEYINCNK